jgi:hypothetical protein
MAQIDASIPLQVKPPQFQTPFELQAQMGAIQNGRNQNRLAQMQFAKAEKDQADENKLSQMFRDANGDPTAVSKAMYGGGYYKQGMAFDKANAEAKGAGYKMENDKLEGVKRQAEISNEQRAIAAQKLGAHLNDPNLSRDSLVADIQTQVQTGELPADKAQALIAKIPDDPAQIKQFLNQILTSMQTADQQLKNDEGTPVDVMRGGKPVKIMSRGGRVVGDAVPSKGLTINTGPVKLSAQAQKELFEADETVQSSKNVIGMLDKALEFNKEAYSGYGASTRATARSNLPGESASANATVDLNNIVTGQALESLKSVFGGMPTEGERKILLELQASTDKTPAQRASIINRAKIAAETRIRFNADKAQKLRSGEYFSSAPTSGESPNAQQPSNIDLLLDKYK